MHREKRYDMSDNRTYYQRDPRFTFGSGLLLAIFVGAVLFVAYVAYSMAPWESDNDAVAPDSAASVETGDTAEDEQAAETVIEAEE